ncbi:MAG: 3-hydroxyacyl-ACP dehydratase FabZ family protein [Planctomycetota bacterium]|nr:3-hydroxyacyl-ACP dehydratase FabZ family protein [Planctomycetota bacterium]
MRFLLVDRITEHEPGRSIRGWKNAALSEDYFEWHFPEQPIVPGMLILEACAQLAGWLEGVTSDFESWLLLDAVRSARYYAFAVPGDRIELTLERIDDGADASRRAFRAETHVDGTRGASIEFEGRVVQLASLEAREATRRAWSRLRGEDA